MNPNDQNSYTTPQPPSTEHLPSPTSANATLQDDRPAAAGVSQPYSQGAFSSVPVAQVPPDASSLDYSKRLKVIGKITIVIGLLSMISSFIYVGPGGVLLGVIINLLLVAIGFGLIQHKKIAYTAFNVFAFLSVPGGIIGILSEYLTVNVGFFSGPNYVSIIISLLLVIFYVKALILLHPKELRSLLR